MLALCFICSGEGLCVPIFRLRVKTKKLLSRRPTHHIEWHDGLSLSCFACLDAITNKAWQPHYKGSTTEWKRDCKVCQRPPQHTASNTTTCARCGAVTLSICQQCSEMHCSQAHCTGQHMQPLSSRSSSVKCTQAAHGTAGPMPTVAAHSQPEAKPNRPATEHPK